MLSMKSQAEDYEVRYDKGQPQYLC